MKDFRDLLPGDKVYQVNNKENMTTVCVRVIDRIVIDKESREVTFSFSRGIGVVISLDDIHATSCRGTNGEMYYINNNFNLYE